MVEEGIDVAIRIGALADSSLVARRIGSVQSITAASTAYLTKFGEPRTQDALKDHAAVRGTFFTVQKALPLLNDGGSIVLVSSGMSVMGIPGHSTYAATKAAIRSFSRTWAAELKVRKIRVNTLSPGPVETPIMDSQASSKEEADKIRAMYASMTPLGRLGLPEEIASAALFLASNESSFSTGIDLVADGGITRL